MPTTVPAASLTGQIQQLLDDRQRHAAVLTEIDQKLAQISTLLGTPVVPAAPKAVAAKPKQSAAAAVTGPQLILDFIAQKGNPTTAEISQAWRAAGRTGEVNPVLAKMIKSGRLKRAEIPGQRGSRYLLAAAGKSAPAPATVAAPAKPAPKAKPARRRRKYSTTATDSILGFIKERGGATTAEINQHWRKEGRKGSADHNLSGLVKEKLLQRTPLGEKVGSRLGSRYTAA